MEYKHTELREKLEGLCKQRKEPHLNCWRSERQNDDRIAVIVSEEFKGKEFVLVEDVLDYLNYSK